MKNTKHPINFTNILFKSLTSSAKKLLEWCNEHLIIYDKANECLVELGILKHRFNKEQLKAIDELKKNNLLEVNNADIVVLSDIFKKTMGYDSVII